jgi:serine/threonine kinase 32
VITRDIKPDNILLDADGHVHLTDFNVASHYSITKPLASIAGSMAYIAPEVISRQGYTFTPDWWSLGITLYEMLFGVRPYNGRNGQELIANVSKGEVPEFFRDPKGRCSTMCIEVLRAVSVSSFIPFYAFPHAVQAGGEGQGCALML